MDFGEEQHARLARAEAVLDHSFSDRAVLIAALTHPSLSGDGTCISDYERLEFLGDALLGFYMADRLHRDHPELPEGRMSKIRARFVSGRNLVSLAHDLGLADAVFHQISGSKQDEPPSYLADVFEALCAALYLDAGLEKAFAFLDRVFDEDVLSSTIEQASDEDPKSLLQEYTQALDGTLPVYEVDSMEGPAHDRVFTITVSLAGRSQGTGIGPSKKLAEKAAAEEALKTLDLH